MCKRFLDKRTEKRGCRDHRGDYINSLTTKQVWYDGLVKTTFAEVAKKNGYWPFVVRRTDTLSKVLDSSSTFLEDSIEHDWTQLPIKRFLLFCQRNGPRTRNGWWSHITCICASVLTCWTRFSLNIWGI